MNTDQGSAVVSTRYGRCLNRRFCAQLWHLLETETVSWRTWKPHQSPNTSPSRKQRDERALPPLLSRT